MRIKKARDGHPIIAYLEDALIGLMSKHYKTRKNFNSESVLLLTKGPLKNEFRAYIEEVRIRLKIPDLDPDTDFQRIPIEDGDIEESSWLYGLRNQKVEAFGDEVTKCLSKFELSNSLREWIEFWFLYNKQPSRYSQNYFEALVDAIKSSDRLKNTSLTSPEKQMASILLREKLGFKKKPNKDASKIYSDVRNTLNQNKNKKRSLRSLNSSLATLETDKGKKYDEIVPKVFSEDQEFEIGASKLKARLRKQKQRLLQRAHTSSK